MAWYSVRHTAACGHGFVSAAGSTCYSAGRRHTLTAAAVVQLRFGYFIIILDGAVKPAAAVVYAAAVLLVCELAHLVAISVESFARHRGVGSGGV